GDEAVAKAMPQFANQLLIQEMQAKGLRGSTAPPLPLFVAQLSSAKPSLRDPSRLFVAQVASVTGIINDDCGGLQKQNRANSPIYSREVIRLTFRRQRININVLTPNVANALGSGTADPITDGSTPILWAKLASVAVSWAL